MSKAASKSEELRKVEVFYKNMATKDGKKFKKWLTKTKDGKIYQVSFVLEAKGMIPKSRAVLTVKECNMNWNRKNPQYPQLYISKIEAVETLESAPEDFDNYFEKA